MSDPDRDFSGPKQTISRRVDDIAAELFELSRVLYEHPETAYEEHEACRWLSDWIGHKGFSVETGVGGIETAFLAKPPGFTGKRPIVAFMAEYDALPGIGHGCGHNLIAASSLGAAAALAGGSPLLDGDFLLIGTPAEEGGGGKARLADGGVFDDVDMALLCHPGRYNRVGDPSLGRIKVHVQFFGKTAHASTAPHLGRNALDALVLAYVNISALRQQLPPDVRLHGIITKGGEAPNIIPDRAEGLYYVRSASKAYLYDILIQRFEDCLNGAAKATGCTYKMTILPPSLEPMLRNPTLERVWADNAKSLGVVIDEGESSPGSSDVGNISHRMPTIQPRLAICDPSVNIHSTDFADATQSETGKAALILSAKTLAMTAYDYLTRPEVRKAATEEFASAAR